MLERIVTNHLGQKVYVTIDGDVLDRIAYDVYGWHGRNTEVLLEANPHVLQHPAVLPAGLVILLPPVKREESPKAFRQLWD